MGPIPLIIVLRLIFPAYPIDHQIHFGEKAKINVSPSAVYAEGLVEIPYSVMNQGALPITFPITFSLNNELIYHEIHVAPEDSFSSSLSMNLSAPNSLQLPDIIMVIMRPWRI